MLISNFSKMYLNLETSIVLSLLITWNECKPAERAETSRTSPFDLAADVKEGLAYNLIQRRIIDSVHVSIKLIKYSDKIQVA